MVGIFSWNNLSVKHKLFGLVLLPIILLFFLAGQHVHNLSTQAQDLQKAQLFSVYIDKVSYLFNLPNNPSIPNKADKTAQLIQELKETTPRVFGDNSEVLPLLASFEEASLSMFTAIDIEEKLDIAEWRADTFEQILLNLDKVYFSNVSYETDRHLSSLMQLEWLMFWSTEERRLSEYLIYSANKRLHYDDAVRDEIQSLIQNQQLLVERFVALNANQNQVQLLIETFSNKVFQTSQEFRDQLLNQEELQALSPLKTGAGLAALNTRLALLHDIDDTMEHELQTKLAQTIKATTQQRLVFIVLMSLVTILVISLTIRLVRKVTNNLHLVLEFLSRENYSEDSPLSEPSKAKMS